MRKGVGGEMPAAIYIPVSIRGQAAFFCRSCPVLPVRFQGFFIKLLFGSKAILLHAEVGRVQREGLPGCSLLKINPKLVPVGFAAVAYHQITQLVMIGYIVTVGAQGCF